MGWTGKLVNKVGHFLSQSVEAPLKHLYKGDTQDDVQGLKIFSFAPTADKARFTNGHCGSDTLSVTAFLLAVLSSSNTKYPMCSDSPEAPVEVPYTSNFGVTSESWEHHGFNEEQAVGTRYKKVQSWQASKHDIGRNDLKECPSYGTLPPMSFSIPVKPPRLSDESSLLSENFRAIIHSALPTIAKDRHWILLYSTARHGISMRTLYQKSSAFPEPFLLVAGDVEGATFGGLVTAPLKPTAQRKYSGTNDTFVFTNLQNTPQIFRATGSNRYYLLCTNDAISLGGGRHFALRLDDSLLTGSSGACNTFGNDCLANSSEFSVSNVEVWGFAYASRHG